jgi:hypothetical protein
MSASARCAAENAPKISGSNGPFTSLKQEGREVDFRRVTQENPQSAMKRKLNCYWSVDS